MVLRQYAFGVINSCPSSQSGDIRDRITSLRCPHETIGVATFQFNYGRLKVLLKLSFETIVTTLISFAIVEQFALTWIKYKVYATNVRKLRSVLQAIMIELVSCLWPLFYFIHNEHLFHEFETTMQNHCKSIDNL